jgi:outer membrane protein
VTRQIFALSSLILGLGLTAVAQAPSAASAAPPPTKVGVIQIQAALVSTKDGQKAVQELNAKLEPRKKDLERKAAEIRELQDKLQRGGNAMAQAAKEDLTRTIDRKTTSYNRDMQDAQDEADGEQRKLLDELGQKMMQVIDKYSTANGFSLILDVSNPNTPVLYASNTIDVTKEIIDLYDKTAPTAAQPKTTPAATKPSAPPVKPPTSNPPPVKKQ